MHIAAYGRSCDLSLTSPGYGLPPTVTIPARRPINIKSPSRLELRTFLPGTCALTMRSPTLYRLSYWTGLCYMSNLAHLMPDSNDVITLQLCGVEYPQIKFEISTFEYLSTIVSNRYCYIAILLLLYLLQYMHHGNLPRVFMVFLY